MKVEACSVCRECKEGNIRCCCLGKLYEDEVWFFGTTTGRIGLVKLQRQNNINIKSASGIEAGKFNESTSTGEGEESKRQHKNHHKSSSLVGQSDAVDVEVASDGHEGEITCMKYAEKFSSADASTFHQILFTGSIDRKVRVWRVKRAPGKQDLECIQSLSSHGGTITDITFGGGSKALRLLTSSTDKTIRVWAPSNGRTLLLYPWLEQVQILQHSTWFTCLEAGQVQSQFDLPIVFAGDSSGVLTILKPESLNRTQQASNTVTELDLSNKLLRFDECFQERYKLHGLGITRLLMIEQQNLVVSLGFDGCVRVFDVAGRAAFLTISNARRVRYLSVAWDSLNHELLIADERGFVELWNVYTDRRLLSWCLCGDQSRKGEVKREQVESQSAGISNCCYVELGQDPTICVSVGSSFQTFQFQRNLQHQEYFGHSSRVLSIMCDSLVNQTMGMESKDAEFDFIKRKKGEIFESKSNFSEGKRSSSAAESGVVTVSIDNTLRGWDWFDMSCLFHLKEPDSEISCAVKIPLYNLIISGNEDGSIRLWGCDSGSTLVLHAHSNTVSSLAVAYRKRNTYLLTASFDGYVSIWDVTKRHVLKPRMECKFRAHGHSSKGASRTALKKTSQLSFDSGLQKLLTEDNGEEILSICFYPGFVAGYPASASSCSRPDSFLTGGNDCLIKLWHFGTFELMCQLEGHTDAVTCIQVDGNFVFSGSDDKSIRIWDVTTPKDPVAINTLTGHNGSVQDLLVLNISPDFNLASCSLDGKIKIWDYTSSAPSDINKKQKGEKELDHSLMEFTNDGLQFTCLAFCESRNELLAGTEEGPIIGYKVSMLPNTKIRENYFQT